MVVRRVSSTQPRRPPADQALASFVAGGGIVYVRIMSTDIVEGAEPGGLFYQCSAEAEQSDGRFAQWVGNGDTIEAAVERAMYLAQAHGEPTKASQWIPYDAPSTKVKRRLKR